MDKLETLLGHKFSNKPLLEQALTHVSAGKNKKSYERLEFLGDRVLSLVIADMLYSEFPTEEEGSLAKRHSALVKQSQLERVAEQMDLKTYIRLSSKDTGIGATGSMLADVIEALIAALYLDGGFDLAQSFIRTQWQDFLRDAVTPPEDGKSALQEWTQAKALPLPDYKLVEQTGPDHKPSFIVEVTIKDLPPQRAPGPSKQQAEKLAATMLLQYIREQKL